MRRSHEDRVLRAVTPREASIFACAADALLAPEPGLPAIHETTAVAAFDDWLARSPALNRYAIRAALYLLELAPRIGGRRLRFRQLDPAARSEFLTPAGNPHPILLVSLIDTLRMLCAAVYYGDDKVALGLGYDAGARVRRGRELRASEQRP